MVYLSPVGLAAAATANSLSLLATYKEKLCKTVCAISSNQPNATVTYTKGTPILNGTTVFVPITAKIVISLPGCNGNQQVIPEHFYVAFQGQTGLPTAVEISSVGTIQGLFKVNCGKSNCYAIQDSLTVTITPAA